VRVFLKLERQEPGRATFHDQAVSRSHWVGPPHRHDELEWNLTVRGHARLLVGEQSYELLPRSMVWLFSGQDHCLAERSADFAMWVLVFKRGFVREWTPEAGSELRRRFPREMRVRFLAEEDAAMLERVARHTSMTETMEARRRSGLACLLLQGWDCFQRARDETEFRDLHPAVARAARLLIEDPARESLAELGREAGLSSSRLSRLFHEQTGVALTIFRARQRLRRFFVLHGRGRNRTVTEVALDAGFQSYVQFYRVFREEMGMGPREYFAVRN